MLCAFKASTQRGGAVTKHVGPNGVRPWGERRSPLRSTEKSSRRAKKIGISNTGNTEALSDLRVEAPLATKDAEALAAGNRC